MTDLRGQRGLFLNALQQINLERKANNKSRGHYLTSITNLEHFRKILMDIRKN